MGNEKILFSHILGLEPGAWPGHTWPLPYPGLFQVFPLLGTLSPACPLHTAQTHSPFLQLAAGWSASGAIFTGDCIEQMGHWEDVN